MNRPDCGAYIPGVPSLSAERSEVFRDPDDPSATCWRTDPLPEGNMRPFADIPIEERTSIVLWSNIVLVGGCADDSCGPCPECCGSRLMPDVTCGDGDGIGSRCCECGDDYTLTITESATGSGTGTHYADPCTTFPAIGHTQPTWEVRATHTASFHFGCETVDLGAGPVLRRKVTGQSVVRIVRRTFFANIEYHLPTSNADPEQCHLISVSQGRTVEEVAEFTRTWDQLAIGDEGCGITPSVASQLGPMAMGLAQGRGYGLRQYNAGECNGEYQQWFDGCSPEAGGPFGIPCSFGIPRVGFDVQWTGYQSCTGGGFTENGTYHQTGPVPVTTIVNGGPPGDTTWLGGEAGSWSYSLQYGVGGGRRCESDPCANQQPFLLRAAKTRQGIVTGASILDRALNAKAKDCNCGKR